MEVNAKTIPYIVERARDVDVNIRRYVYKKSLVDIGDYRLFSISDRERILEWGLLDREESVREACTYLLNEIWIPKSNNSIIEVRATKVVNIKFYVVFKPH